MQPDDVVVAAAAAAEMQMHSTSLLLQQQSRQLAAAGELHDFQCKSQERQRKKVVSQVLCRQLPLFVG
uniref:GG16738 n=1 Tax=Drosophila erecta TaxID=7220 RepID=B3P8P7_DROER